MATPGRPGGFAFGARYVADVAAAVGERGGETESDASLDASRRPAPGAAARPKSSGSAGAAAGGASSCSSSSSTGANARAARARVNSRAGVASPASSSAASLAALGPPDPELSHLLTRLGKRDARTRSRALVELGEALDGGKDAAFAAAGGPRDPSTASAAAAGGPLDPTAATAALGPRDAAAAAALAQRATSVLGIWSLAFARVAADEDVRVRLEAARVAGRVAAVCGRAVAATLPAMLAPWLLLAADSSREVARAARASMALALPGDRTAKALLAHGPRAVEGLAAYADGSSSALEDPKEDPEARRRRLEGVTLAAWAALGLAAKLDGALSGGELAWNAPEKPTGRSSAGGNGNGPADSSATASDEPSPPSACPNPQQAAREARALVALSAALAEAFESRPGIDRILGVSVVAPGAARRQGTKAAPDVRRAVLRALTDAAQAGVLDAAADERLLRVLADALRERDPTVLPAVWDALLATAGAWKRAVARTAHASAGDVSTDSSTASLGSSILPPASPFTSSDATDRVLPALQAQLRVSFGGGSPDAYRALLPLVALLPRDALDGKALCAIVDAAREGRERPADGSEAASAARPPAAFDAAPGARMSAASGRLLDAAAAEAVAEVVALALARATKDAEQADTKPYLAARRLLEAVLQHSLFPPTFEGSAWAAAAAAAVAAHVPQTAIDALVDAAADDFSRCANAEEEERRRVGLGRRGVGAGSGAGAGVGVGVGAAAAAATSVSAAEHAVGESPRAERGTASAEALSLGAPTSPGLPDAQTLPSLPSTALAPTVPRSWAAGLGALLEALWARDDAPGARAAAVELADVAIPRLLTAAVEGDENAARLAARALPRSGRADDAEGAEMDGVRTALRRLMIRPREARPRLEAFAALYAALLPRSRDPARLLAEAADELLDAGRLAAFFALLKAGADLTLSYEHLGEALERLAHSALRSDELDAGPEVAPGTLAADGGPVELARAPVRTATATSSAEAASALVELASGAAVALPPWALDGVASAALRRVAEAVAPRGKVAGPLSRDADGLCAAMAARALGGVGADALAGQGLGFEAIAGTDLAEGPSATLAGSRGALAPAVPAGVARLPDPAASGSPVLAEVAASGRTALAARAPRGLAPLAAPEGALAPTALAAAAAAVSHAAARIALGSQGPRRRVAAVTKGRGGAAGATAAAGVAPGATSGAAPNAVARDPSSPLPSSSSPRSAIPALASGTPEMVARRGACDPERAAAFLRLGILAALTPAFAPDGRRTACAAPLLAQWAAEVLTERPAVAAQVLALAGPETVASFVTDLAEMAGAYAELVEDQRDSSRRNARRNQRPKAAGADARRPPPAARALLSAAATAVEQACKAWGTALSPHDSPHARNDRSPAPCLRNAPLAEGHAGSRLIGAGASRASSRAPSRLHSTGGSGSPSRAASRASSPGSSGRSSPPRSSLSAALASKAPPSAGALASAFASAKVAPVPSLGRALTIATTSWSPGRAGLLLWLCAEGLGADVPGAALAEARVTLGPDGESVSRRVASRRPELAIAAAKAERGDVDARLAWLEGGLRRVRGAGGAPDEGSAADAALQTSAAEALALLAGDPDSEASLVALARLGGGACAGLWADPEARALASLEARAAHAARAAASALSVGNAVRARWCLRALRAAAPVAEPRPAPDEWFEGSPLGAPALQAGAPAWYYDRARSLWAPVKVETVDLTVSPPSYEILLPDGSFRHTEGGRLRPRAGVAPPLRPPAGPLETAERETASDAKLPFKIRAALMELLEASVGGIPGRRPATPSRSAAPPATPALDSARCQAVAAVLSLSPADVVGTVWGAARALVVSSARRAARDVAIAAADVGADVLLAARDAAGGHLHGDARTAAAFFLEIQRAAPGVALPNAERAVASARATLFERPGRGGLARRQGASSGVAAGSIGAEASAFAKRANERPFGVRFADGDADAPTPAATLPLHGDVEAAPGQELPVVVPEERRAKRVDSMLLFGAPSEAGSEDQALDDVDEEDAESEFGDRSDVGSRSDLGGFDDEDDEEEAAALRDMSGVRATLTDAETHQKAKASAEAATAEEAARGVDDASEGESDADSDSEAAFGYYRPARAADDAAPDATDDAPPLVLLWREDAPDADRTRPPVGWALRDALRAAAAVHATAAQVAGGRGGERFVEEAAACGRRAASAARRALLAAGVALDALAALPSPELSATLARWAAASAPVWAACAASMPVPAPEDAGERRRWTHALRPGGAVERTCIQAGTTPANALAALAVADLAGAGEASDIAMRALLAWAAPLRAVGAARDAPHAPPPRRCGSRDASHAHAHAHAHAHGAGDLERESSSDSGMPGARHDSMGFASSSDALASSYPSASNSAAADSGDESEANEEAGAGGDAPDPLLPSPDDAADEAVADDGGEAGSPAEGRLLRLGLGPALVDALTRARASPDDFADPFFEDEAPSRADGALAPSRSSPDARAFEPWILLAAWLLAAPRARRLAAGRILRDDVSLVPAALAGAWGRLFAHGAGRSTKRKEGAGTNGTSGSDPSQGGSGAPSGPAPADAAAGYAARALDALSLEDLGVGVRCAGAASRSASGLLAASDSAPRLGDLPPHRGLSALDLAGAVSSDSAAATVARAPPEALPVLPAAAFEGILSSLPGVAHDWAKTLQSRGESAALRRYASQAVSPRLVAAEMAGLEALAASLQLHDAFSVRCVPAAREAVATLEVEEGQCLELRIRLAADAPLEPPAVECVRRVGVSDAKMRRWLLSVQSFLRGQQGSVADAVDLWRANLRRQFEGQEECIICYSVLEPGSGRLPTKTCKVCKKRFHGGCLYKWFRSSGKSQCPHCQSPW